MKVVILTPLSLEYDAVRKHLPVLTDKIFSGKNYGIADFEGSHHTFQIILHQTGSKNNTIALAAEKAIQTFEPQVVIIVGIAGGVKDVNIGDVVIGTKAYGYESGKETEEGFVARPEVYHYSVELISVAQITARKGHWKKRLQNNSSQPKVFFGPIASGDKVIATTSAQINSLLKKHFNDTLALEMEAVGFSQAIDPYRGILSLNIRGISDLLENKTKSDASGTQIIAADNAAAFAFEVLKNLNLSEIKNLNMDIKTIAKEVFGLILPIIESESMKKIGGDFKEATNTSTQELWEKVKPLFIEEFDNLKEVVDDEDGPALARRALRKGMEKNDTLKGELEQLLEKLKLAGGGIVSGSKNVIQGSQISVGGDFHLGDDIQQKVSQNNSGRLEKQQLMNVKVGKIEGEARFNEGDITVHENVDASKKQNIKKEEGGIKINFTTILKGLFKSKIIDADAKNELAREIVLAHEIYLLDSQKGEQQLKKIVERIISDYEEKIRNKEGFEYRLLLLNNLEALKPLCFSLNPIRTNIDKRLSEIINILDLYSSDDHSLVIDFNLVKEAISLILNPK
ncbi:MAG: hypothetical protein DWQ02_14405 [Bacteroidetes bacterium]|nr:MAG: hypothetical protein DWQ02_14405 [Bacteroidota bacterium]